MVRTARLSHLPDDPQQLIGRQLRRHECVSDMVGIDEGHGDAAALLDDMDLAPVGLGLGTLRELAVVNVVNAHHREDEWAAAKRELPLHQLGVVAFDPAR
jgi:hypothetical protein